MTVLDGTNLCKCGSRCPPYENIQAKDSLEYSRESRYWNRGFNG